MREKIRLAKAGLGILFFLMLLFSFYHLYYADKVIPGVYLGNIHLGGKNITQASSVLEGQASQIETFEIVDHDMDIVYEIDISDIELKYLIDHTIEVIFIVGRTKNFPKDSLDKLKGLIFPIKIDAVVTLDPIILEQRITQIKGVSDVPAKSAEYILEDGEITIVPSENGRKIRADVLEMSVINAIMKMDNSPISLLIDKIEPEVTTQDLKDAQEDIEKLIERVIKIELNEETIDVLSSHEILDLIEVVKNNGKIEIQMNQYTFREYRKSIESKVNTTPRAHVTKESSEGLVQGFEIITTGNELIADAFESDLKKAFFTTEKEIVNLKMDETGQGTDHTKYGIITLLGRGESNYSGSPATRAYNLNLAAERASGVLVPPGGTYSLLSAVGPITTQTGFGQALVIMRGQTIPGTGGGVCQTSTSLFRAALNSGLPIVERYPHAYRVGYYENDMPVGFDAAIYQPSPDLKFKNDTEAYILVQAEFMKEQSKLGFRIYGTPDGREVSISDPIIGGMVPPPEPLYKETDDLKKGEIRQVENAIWGTTSTFTRKVTRDGEILFEETYQSVYSPWRAVYLVGTAD